MTLTTQQIPSHYHTALAAAVTGDQPNAPGTARGQLGQHHALHQQLDDTAFNGSAIAAAGGSQPHTNLQPYLCVDFIISLFGIFPPPS